MSSLTPRNYEMSNLYSMKEVNIKKGEYVTI